MIYTATVPRREGEGVHRFASLDGERYVEVGDRLDLADEQAVTDLIEGKGMAVVPMGIAKEVLEAFDAKFEETA